MPLTVVIPCSQSDLPRLDSTISVMEFLGGLQRHSVLFCCAPSTQAVVSEAAARLRTVCPNVLVEVLPREPEGTGRYSAFNMIFRDSVEILAKRGNKNPWLWMELDLVPIKGGWVDRLELEYHQKGQPFLGVRRRASEVMRGPNGEKLDDRDPRVQGEYMVAVGIYPPNFKDYSTMYKYPDPTGRMPTDVNIRHEISRHLHGTQLIDHHYKTGNYRRVDGRIVCDDHQHTDGWPKYGGTVSDMAYLVHGDKTGTLAALVLSEAPGNVQEMPRQAMAQTPDVSAELARLKAENEEMRRDIAKMHEEWRVKENSYADEIEQLKEGKAQPQVTPSPAPKNEATDDIPQNNPLPKIEDVRKAVEASPTKKMIGEWAADFKIDKTAFRKLIEDHPDSGLIIAKPGPPFVKIAA